MAIELLFVWKTLITSTDMITSVPVGGGVQRERQSDRQTETQRQRGQTERQREITQT